MIGGLLLSQVLTLYTTPVIYIFFSRLGHWCRATPNDGGPGSQGGRPEAP
jgi:hypothetical protein